MEGNREYKSDVFSMLMEDKRNALEVYNALNGTAFIDPDMIEIVTLDRGVSLSVKNDASFLLDFSLNLWEHQSTICKNMPLRLFFYVAKTLHKLTANKNLYGKKLIEIPTPKFVVFYNGTEEMTDMVEMRLSDAFQKKTDQPELELVCKVYNINVGHNEEMLSKCSVLRRYMTFVDTVRHNMKQYQEEKRSDKEYVKDAIRNAIDYCIENDILKEFFLARREEVMKVMELDFTFEKRLEMTENEAYEDGKIEGEEIGKEIGKTESMQESILEFLQEQFSITDELREKIITIDDYEKLKELNKIAARARTIEEFEKAL